MLLSPRFLACHTTGYLSSLHSARVPPYAFFQDTWHGASTIVSWYRSTMRSEAKVPRGHFSRKRHAGTRKQTESDARATGFKMESVATTYDNQLVPGTPRHCRCSCYVRVLYPICVDNPRGPPHENLCFLGLALILMKAAGVPGGTSALLSPSCLSHRCQPAQQPLQSWFESSPPRPRRFAALNSTRCPPSLAALARLLLLPQFCPASRPSTQFTIPIHVYNLHTHLPPFDAGPGLQPSRRRRGRDTSTRPAAFPSVGATARRPSRPGVPTLLRDRSTPTPALTLRLRTTTRERWRCTRPWRTQTSGPTRRYQGFRRRSRRLDRRWYGLGFL